VTKGRCCSHTSHLACGKRWVESNDRCRACRSFMVTPEEFKEAARDTMGEDWVRDAISISRGLGRVEEFMIIFSYPLENESTMSESGNTEDDCDSVSLSSAEVPSSPASKNT
jgi:hypothetical protein